MIGKYPIVLIWDFDGVILNNVSQRYNDAFLIELLSMNEPCPYITNIPGGDGIVNILFTGRSIEQSPLIKTLLSNNGIHMDAFYFSEFTYLHYALNNFLDVYYAWKFQIFETKIGPKYQDYQKVVLDDDGQIIMTLRQTKYFETTKLNHVQHWIPIWTLDSIMKM